MPATTLSPSVGAASSTTPPATLRAAAARTIAALLTIRDQVIAPLLAGIRTPRRGRPPATWTRIDRDYEALRVDMHTLFQDLGLTTAPAAA